MQPTEYKAAQQRVALAQMREERIARLQIAAGKALRWLTEGSIPQDTRVNAAISALRDVNAEIGAI